MIMEEQSSLGNVGQRRPNLDVLRKHQSAAYFFAGCVWLLFAFSSVFAFDNPDAGIGTALWFGFVWAYPFVLFFTRHTWWGILLPVATIALFALQIVWFIGTNVLLSGSRGSGF